MENAKIGQVVQFEYMAADGQYGVWEVEIVKIADDFITGKVIHGPVPQQWGTFRFARMGQVWA